MTSFNIIYTLFCGDEFSERTDVLKSRSVNLFLSYKKNSLAYISDLWGNKEILI